MNYNIYEGSVGNVKDSLAGKALGQADELFSGL
jgi:hypothetical protein